MREVEARFEEAAWRYSLALRQAAQSAADEIERARRRYLQTVSAPPKRGAGGRGEDDARARMEAHFEYVTTLQKLQAPGHGDVRRLDAYTAYLKEIQEAWASLDVELVKVAFSPEY